jgi:type IV pilus assembly protein PilC
MIIIFTFVMPSFMTVLDGMTLPLPTRVVMALSNFLTHNFVEIIAAVVIIVAAVIFTFKQPAPRLALDKVKLRVPKLGKLFSVIYTSRFARTLASLYVSGIPMIQSLKICRSTMGNTYLDKQFDDVIQDLANGRTLSQSLVKVDGFEGKLKSTIMIGEESGRLEAMLDSVADQYDYDSEVATSQMVAMLEPAMIVILAGMVAFIMLSVMLPIFQMYQAVGAGA